MTKIAILGTGNVAITFARGLIKHGHQVRLGTRNPDKPSEAVAKFQQELTGDHKNILLETVKASEWAELVFLATSWAGTIPTAKAAATALAGKVVIDVTNPIIAGKSDYPVQMEKLETSGGEMVQAIAPKAHVVKCWNTVGFALFIDPVMADGKQPTMFFCGNDSGAKETVMKLLHETGWKGFDVGPIAASRFLEPMCSLWCNIGIKTGNWSFALDIHDSKK